MTRRPMAPAACAWRAPIVLVVLSLGLVAAIPAVVIYNHLARVISGYRTLLGDASAQLLLMVSRGHRGRAAPLPRAAE